MSHETIEDPWSLAVLLVEDDPAAARVVRERLASERRGHLAVEVVPRLEQAVEALRQRAYDVLLIDLALPREPGLETLLGAQMLAQRIPIVVMTTYPDEELGVRAVEAGIQEYLMTGGGIPADLGGTLRHAAIRHRIVAKLRRSCQVAACRASRDPATGLASRPAFLRKLWDALEFAERFHERPALLLVEPEDFAAVKERLGPVLGANLLQELSRRLSWCVRRSDCLGRLTDEEFAVLVPHAATSPAIRMIAERIRLTFTAPFRTGGPSLRLRASLGAAWYPMDGETVGALVKAAETALAEARDLGGNRCQLFRGHDVPPWPEDVASALSLQQTAAGGPG
ncbi:MAG TPA: GGDEF domain-containing response regulator [Thermoanaerobaculia bacterium]|jgi:diguanylate cyclase (GGDEF)-like protein|nr:GGDEF domain-containing response regulator [Thermoanaerobaculia bacterium]